MSVFIVDGVKYKLWIPKEEKQLEEIVKEHVKDIFGESSIYFEKRKISSEYGIPSIPDGFVIDFISKKLYAIEIELSTHRYDHIVSQGNRHIDAIRDLSTRNKIVRGFNEELKSDPSKKSLAENFVKGELFEFLTSISENPELVIIADEISNDIRQAETVFAARIKTHIRDFKTFERESIGLGVHAHFFEPLYELAKVYVEDEVLKVHPMFPLYQELKKFILSLGDVECYIIGGKYPRFRRRRVFATVWFTRKWISLELFVGQGAVKSERFKYWRSGESDWGYVHITPKEGLDEEVKDWIRKAYGNAS